MIKKICYLLILIQISCNPKDCFEPAGKIVSQEIQVSAFDKILVGNEVSLIIKQGLEQEVIVKTGKNLMDQVSVKVTNGRLEIADNNTCNFVRDYAITKVIVTSPNIKEIRSNTARTIKSEGVLKFPVLFLLSEDFLDYSLLNIGDFDLDVEMDNLIVRSNGNSQFTIRGKTNGLRVEFEAGSPRFNGKNLIVKKGYIIQKSTNDIIINPQNSLKAYIYTIGNVISYHMPPLIEVEEHYTGRLIFH